MAQQAALLTIDTACHGVRGAESAIGCLVDPRRGLIKFHISLGET